RVPRFGAFLVAGDPVLATIQDPSRMSPEISVVVAAHDEEKTLPACIGSLRQCSGNFEIIVVDNNAQDRTAEVAESLGARVVHCATPGAVHAKSAGVQAAQAPIVAVLD